MNERLKEIARQAKLSTANFIWLANDSELERFVDLVRQDEREACAKAMQPMLRDMISRGQAADIIRARGDEMNRLDLIIDALESAHHTNDTAVMGLTKLRLDVALAAARELRELKPVAFIENHKAGQNLSWSQDDLPYAKATPLYALDEVTK